jgi:SAM-dependent methyltransferase
MINIRNLGYDLNHLIRYVDGLIEQHGFTAAALGWTKDKQSLRFKVLCEIGLQRGCKILDFGCGLADLYAYCQSRYKSVEYLGIDINPTLVAECRRRYPKTDIRCVNILTDKLRDRVDFVILSGTFNYPFRKVDNYEFVESVLSELFNQCECGIAADFFSTSVDYRDERLFYADPTRIFEIARRLSRRVLLRHDYFPFEFCVYIYKDDSMTDRYVFRGFEKAPFHNKRGVNTTRK